MRRGHTLFEVLVALGLSLALLAAVYSALDLHWKYSAAGQEETERLQLVRALFLKMEGDVRSIIYRRPPQAVEPQGGVPVSQNLDANTAQTPDPYSGYGIGLIGDAHRLLLQVSEPVEDPYSPLSGPAIGQSREIGKQVHRVLWFISRNDGASQNQTDQSKAAKGLARLAANEFAFDPLDRRENLKDRVTPGDVLAKEVQTIRFRYFDGSQWLDQWDSVAMRRLPRAIEIVIGFSEADFALRDFDEKQHSGSYRLVVAVPAYET